MYLFILNACQRIINITIYIIICSYVTRPAKTNHVSTKIAKFSSLLYYVYVYLYLQNKMFTISAEFNGFSFAIDRKEYHNHN